MPRGFRLFRVRKIPPRTQPCVKLLLKFTLLLRVSLTGAVKGRLRVTPAAKIRESLFKIRARYRLIGRQISGIASPHVLRIRYQNLHWKMPFRTDKRNLFLRVCRTKAV